MFTIEYHLPKNSVWKFTLGHHDEQPFGRTIFSSVSSSSLPQGYTFSRGSLCQLEQEDTTQRKGILVISDNLRLSDIDVNALLEIAECGDKIILVDILFSRCSGDTLQFRSYYSYFSPIALKKYTTSFTKKDNLHWIEDSTVHLHQALYFYPQLCSSYFRGDSLPGRVLTRRVSKSNEFRCETEADLLATDSFVYMSIAMSRRWGKGEVILISAPLIFANYGILDGKDAAHVFRLLPQTRKLPIVRTKGYMKETVQAQQSPFRYFLTHRPLRWTSCLTMITTIPLVIFIAKRRQRVIPAIREPANKSFELIKLTSTLYFQEEDRADLVREKFSHSAEKLRREIRVDIEEMTDDERSFHRVAWKAGVDTGKITEFIRGVRPVIYGGRIIDTKQMEVYIDKVSEIINHI